MVIKVKTAKRRSTASAEWLKRQLNDPYVTAAQKQGYRSRAAFKLLEIDDKYKILKPGQKILDLGAAPGGWTQVLARRCASDPQHPTVVGLDLLAIDAIPGAILLQGDFMADDAPERLIAECGGKVHGVVSDMAPNTIGHAATDHLRIIALVEAAYDFARQVLLEGGFFVCKVFQGGAEKELLAQIRRDCAQVTHFKPPASRKDSAEIYLVARGFKGNCGII